VAQVGPRARGSGMGQKNERFCYASFHIWNKHIKGHIKGTTTISLSA
jgi:hypothetical protein